MKTSLISIIIPTYNSSRTIKKCLDSICVQSIKNYELIIVDDGSTDNTTSIITEYAQSHKNIELIIQSHQGVSAARNKGLARSKGDYIVFIDSDDTIEKDYLKSLLHACQDSQADIAICNFKTITKREKDNSTIKEYSIIKPEDYIAKLPQIFHGYLWNKMYSKNATNGIEFDQNITYCEDFLFNLQIAKSIKTIVTVPQHLYNYTRTDQSVGATFDQKYNASIIVAIEKIMKIIEQNYPNTIMEYVVNFLPIVYQQRFLLRRNHLQPNPTITMLLHKYESNCNTSHIKISAKHKIKLYICRHLYPLLYQYRIVKAKIGR